MNRLIFLATLLACILILAACTGGAVPTPIPAVTPTPILTPTTDSTNSHSHSSANAFTDNDPDKYPYPCADFHDGANQYPNNCD